MSISSLCYWKVIKKEANLCGQQKKREMDQGFSDPLESLESGSVIFECKEGPFVEHEVEGILEVFNLETDFFGDLHCSSRFTDMLCDAQAQYGDYSELDECPMWGMWENEGRE